MDDAWVEGIAASPWLIPVLFALVVGDAAIVRVRIAVHRRTAVLVFTARYVPFARIAVNLATGAGRVPLSRYLPLSTAAGVAWACYNVAIGAVVGSFLHESPLLAAGISIPIAIVLGLLVDRLDAHGEPEGSVASLTRSEPDTP